MNTNQENRYNMYLAVKELLSSWLDILNLLPHFNEFYTSFLSDVEAIQHLSEQQLFHKKGSGVNKKGTDVKLALVNLAAQTADKLYAYALFIKDQILQNELHYSLSTMKQSSNATVLKWSKGIYERSDLHLANVTSYGITEATQLDFKKLIDNFEKLMPAQRISTTNKNLITKQLTDHYTSADQMLEQIDALIKILSATQPNLCTTYDLRRKILNYGTRSIAVQGLVIDAATKAGLKGVTIALLKADGTPLQPAIVKKSAEKGGFKIKTLDEGVYQAKLTKVGYKEQVITNTITKGVLNKIIAEMTKI